MDLISASKRKDSCVRLESVFVPLICLLGGFGGSVQPAVHSDILLLYLLLGLFLPGTYHNGSRQTEVVNKQKVFLPPRPLLSAYMEQMSSPGAVPATLVHYRQELLDV